MIADARSPSRFAILWHSVPNSPAANAEHPTDASPRRKYLPERDPHSIGLSVSPQPIARVAVSHFDLMLQLGEVLWTWELLRLPIHGETINAVRLEDHRLKYLDYEGPLRENRGHVIGWERGDLVWQKRSSEALEVLLFGTRLTAKLILCRFESADQAEDRWNISTKIWQVEPNLKA